MQLSSGNRVMFAKTTARTDAPQEIKKVELENTLKDTPITQKSKVKVWIVWLFMRDIILLKLSNDKWEKMCLKLLERSEQPQVKNESS